MTMVIIATKDSVPTAGFPTEVIVVAAGIDVCTGKYFF